eukprot:scaffold9041_cov171-Cylindrotheca_fusiformis.AAC.2
MESYYPQLSQPNLRAPVLSYGEVHCKNDSWTDILTFNGKSLLWDYGEITVTKIIAARDARRAKQISTNAEMRPMLDAKMIYEFIYESLGTAPRKKIVSRVDQDYFLDDGPLLLKTVLDDTYVTTQSSVFSVKEKFHELHLKNYKWNVLLLLNQDVRGVHAPPWFVFMDVRDKRVELQASGSSISDTDTIIHLFRAYKTSTAVDFQSAVLYWKSEYAVDHNLDHLPRQHQQLYQLQLALGPLSPFYGFFHQEWVRLQNDYLIGQGLPHNKNQACVLISKWAHLFLTSARAQWTARNSFLHEDTTTTTAHVRVLLKLRIQELYAQQETIPEYDRRQLFGNSTMEQRMDLPPLRQKEWIASTRALLKNAQRKANKPPAGNSDIRSFFTPSTHAKGRHSGRPPG